MRPAASSAGLEAGPAGEAGPVAVIGSGISGLTCAYELQRSGFRVHVYEREARVGGRMRTRVRDGLAFDLGANFLVAAYSSLNGLASELGVGLHSMSPVRHALYRGGQLRTMNFENARDVVRMDALGLWSKVRFLEFMHKLRHDYPGLDFFDLSQSPAELNTEDAYSYACREIGREFADYILDPFHSCMMFYRSQESSAAAFLTLFQMKSDPRFDFSILHAEGEMQRIPDAIAAKVPVRTGCPVVSITRREEGWLVRTADSAEVYQWVVLATTAGAAARILDTAPPGHLAVLEQTEYAATINLAFRVPSDLLGRTHCFYLPFLESPLIAEFTNESLKEPGRKGVSLSSSRDPAGTEPRPESGSSGLSLVNVGLHEVAARALMKADDDRLFALIGQELARLHPPLKGALPHDLQRWPEAMPKYTCEHLARVKEFLSVHQGQDGLFLCGDYLNAPWLEGASRCGWRVAAQLIMQALGPPRAA